MSEIQNKAISLVAQTEGGAPSRLNETRRDLLLARAMDLYLAMGGSATEAATLAGSYVPDGVPRIENGVAGVMVELAAVSHMHDIDMIQATYNRLDAELEPAAKHRRR